MSHKIETLISREKVETRIKELAKEIERDYSGKHLICIALLKGSVIFFSDLLKEINIPLEMDFMNVSSYGNETVSTGVVKVLKDTDLDLFGKDVLIVEDIIDTGFTLEYVKKMIQIKGAASVKCATLLDKPERRKVDIKAEYIGFEIPDEFVIGYGLDYCQKYRNLPFIGIMKIDEN